MSDKKMILGDVDVMDLRLGSVQVLSAYMGSELVWPIGSQGQPSNEFWYTSTAKVLPRTSSWGNATIVSNEYSGGNGVITFDQDITLVPSSAFKSDLSLKSVSLPDSVAEIGTEAFQGCRNLSSVTTSGLVNIGGWAFYGCGSLHSFDIPQTVTGIGQAAFCYAGLSSVTIPDGVQRIEQDTFNCEGGPNASGLGNTLEFVEIGSGVSYIGRNAFARNSNLGLIRVNRMTPPFFECGPWSSETRLNFDNMDSFMDVGEYGVIQNPYGSDYTSWRKCGLNTWDLQNGVPSNEIWYTTTDSATISPNTNASWNNTVISNTYENGRGVMRFANNLTRIPDKGFSALTGGGAYYESIKLTSISLPPSITAIGSGAFHRCSAVTEFVVPYGVSSIGSGAFRSCSSTTGVYLPDTVTAIPSGCIGFCGNISGFPFPKNVTSIGVGAFEWAVGLKTLDIPDSVTTIEGPMFVQSSPEGYTLKNLRIGNGVTTMPSSGIAGPKNIEWLVIGSSLDTTTLYRAGNYLSGFSALYWVEFESGCTTIGNNTCRACMAMTKLSIPNTVTSIGNSAFYSSTVITSVTIPDSVQTIGQAAFRYCNGMKEIKIGSGLASVGYSGLNFQGGNLSSITITALNAPSLGNSGLRGRTAGTNYLYTKQGAGSYSTWLTALGNTWTEVKLSP